ncbi:MAG: hypothetical protein A2138_19760 [Deltaproteobacteria bacterium RBG_16_71_12]|nr:MAG: hypothetical protein A2138_19760 [Deltaproteobacteria bacterium RBG_16_71_12]
MKPMKLVQGKVIDGAVVVDGERLEEGALVTVLVRDEDEVALSPEDEDELIAAREEIARGDYLTTGELFDLLRRQRER